MRIGPIDLVKRVLVVAEIGNNHEGNVEVARELVRRAAAAGADAVKFQTFRTKYFVSARDRARYDRLSSFQLSYDDFADLQRLARSLGLLFISTPLDLESAAFLAPLVDAVKIASGDNNFYPLLTAACRSDKPIIMSTGLSDLDQIRKSQRFIEERESCSQTDYHAPEEPALHRGTVARVRGDPGARRASLRDELPDAARAGQRRRRAVSRRRARLHRRIL